MPEFDHNKKTDILYIGMALIDSIVKGFDPVPVSASGYRAEAGSLHAGGEAVNGSIASAKLGLKSSILCALGKDAGGDIVVGELETNGVDTSLVQRIASHSTPVTTMLVETDGSRKSITNKTHAYNFHPERFKECLNDSKIVCLSSLFRAPFDDPEIIAEVVREAKDNGAIVFADTKIPNFSSIRLADVIESMPFIDYIFPNEDEAEFFTGESEADKMADSFLELGVKNVIIKRGGDGSFFKSSKERIFTTAFKVDVADTTGAGDNFIAGFAEELLSGRSHEEALKFANACGAVSATKEGALAGLLSKEQVCELAASGRYI